MTINRVLELVAFLGPLGIGSCLPAVTGCAQMDFDQKMTMLKQARDFAVESGASYVITLDIDGRPEVGLSESAYLDTGIKARITVSGNAQATPTPDPLKPKSREPEIVEP